MQKPSSTEASTGKDGVDKFSQIMFEPLNNYFDKIYVITLQRATDRHLQLQQELQGLNYTLMYGVDKLNINKAELIQNKRYDAALAVQHHIMSKEMSPGEMGCAFSHRMVYEDVVKNGYKRVLILEDDVVIDRKKITLFDAIINELPPDWGLWYLGFDKNEQPPANTFFKKLFYHLLFATGIKNKFNHTIIGNLYPKPFSKYLQIAGFHNCTHAYAVTTDTAKILLEMQTPLSYIADHLLGYASSSQLVKALITQPKLINQQYQVSADPIKSYLN